MDGTLAEEYSHFGFYEVIFFIYDFSDGGCSALFDTMNTRSKLSNRRPHKDVDPAALVNRNT